MSMDMEVKHQHGMECAKLVREMECLHDKLECALEPIESYVFDPEDPGMEYYDSPIVEVRQSIRELRKYIEAFVGCMHVTMTEDSGP